MEEDKKTQLTQENDEITESILEIMRLIDMLDDLEIALLGFFD